MVRIVAIALVCAFGLSGVYCPAYAISNPSDSALAPPLRTASGEIVYDEEAGKWDIITHHGTIRYWDEETRRSVIDGIEVNGKRIKLPDKSFRNRWAYMDISYLISQMLILTQQHKLQNPKEILIPLIKKHIRNRGGEAEMLLEGYDIDHLQEMREGEVITGFSLPVTRDGTPAYRLVYNLQGGDTNISLSNGTSVYVKAESITNKPTIDKSSLRSIFPESDYLSWLRLDILSPSIMLFSAEPEEVKKRLESLDQRLNDGFDELIRTKKTPSEDVKVYFLQLAQLIKESASVAKEILPMLTYDSHKRWMEKGVLSAENFVNGIEMLLDESAKQVDINNTLEKMLGLTFSQYYRSRGAKYTINKHLSSDVPAISAQQDEIAYLFFSLILPLRKMREVDLSISTQLTSDKQGKHITVTIATPQEIPLTNVVIDGKDTGIGFELTKRIVQKYGGTIDVQSPSASLGTGELGKGLPDVADPGQTHSQAKSGTTFTLRLPIADTTSSGQAIRLPIADETNVMASISRTTERAGYPSLETIDLFFHSHYIDKDIYFGKHDFEQSRKIVGEIVKRDIQKVIVVGDSLQVLPIYLALLGRDVIYIEENRNGARLRESIYGDVVDDIRKDGFDNEYRLKIINSEIGTLDLEAHGLEAGGFDLVTLIDLGCNPVGNPVQWFTKARELLKPQGYIVIDETDWTQHEIIGSLVAQKPVPTPGLAVSAFSRVFPNAERVMTERIIGTYSWITGVSNNVMYEVNAETAKLRIVQEQDIIAFVRATLPGLIKSGKPINILDVGTGKDPQFCYRMKELLEKNGIAVNMFGIQPKTAPSEELEESIILAAKKNGITLEEIGLEDFNENKSGIARDNKFNLIFVNAPTFYIDEEMLKNVRASLDTNGRLIITSFQEDDDQFDRQAMIDIINARFNVYVKETKLIGLPTSDAFSPLDISIITQFISEPHRSSGGKITPTSKTNDEIVVKIAPEAECIHTTTIQDTLVYMQTQQQAQPVIVALGTSWIKGYEKGRYLQYDALNPLISNMGNHPQFIVGDDKSLLAEIRKKMGEKGFENARVIVLAGEETVTKELAELDNGKNILFGVDNKHLTVDSYVRVMEMLAIASRLALDPNTPPNSPNIPIERRGNFWVFIPRAEPYHYEKLKVTYELQKFA